MIDLPDHMEFWSDLLEDLVKNYGVGRIALALCLVAFLCSLSAQAQEAASAATVPVRMTVTLSALGDKATMPTVNREDVTVTPGRRGERLKVTGWTAATGAHAALDLFILIDDASTTALGSQLDSLRSFINAQPATTAVGVGYMSNATVQIVQNLTTDHAAAARVVRLPRANTGAFGSPFLSVVNLMNGWPAHPARRVIVMVTDGIDRARGGPRARGLGPTNPDVIRASDVAQRTGTIIYTIFHPGVGYRSRNLWEATNGQNGIARLSDESGGEAFFLGLQTPVSFGPFLDGVQTALNNQYLLEFRAVPGRRAGAQSVSVSTEVPGVEIISAETAWVPAANQQ